MTTLLDVAHSAASIQLAYARQGTSLASAALAGAVSLEPFRHYPARDVKDALNGTQFYYHAHTSRRRPAAEHGHFHLFVNGQNRSGTSACGTDFFHLAGLSIDAMGQSLRWFTTNRWVTGEQWRKADDIVQALHRFEVHAQGRMSPVADWLSAMVRLFEKQITDLIYRRDEVMARHVDRLGREVAFEDRKLDVVTQCAISLPHRLRQLSL